VEISGNYWKVFEIIGN